MSPDPSYFRGPGLPQYATCTGKILQMIEHIDILILLRLKCTSLFLILTIAKRIRTYSITQSLTDVYSDTVLTTSYCILIPLFGYLFQGPDLSCELDADMH
jgi:hypothetical protein